MALMNLVGLPLEDQVGMLMSLCWEMKQQPDKWRWRRFIDEIPEGIPRIIVEPGSDLLESLYQFRLEIFPEEFELQIEMVFPVRPGLLCISPRLKDPEKPESLWTRAVSLVSF